MTPPQILAVASLLSVLAVLHPPSAAAEGGVVWQELSVEAALQAASETETLVLIDVYASWCGPCMRLDREVFPTTQAALATDGLIALRIDAEAGEGPAVTERWHVVGYPTLLLLNGKGEEVDRLFGFLPPDEFAETLIGYREGRGTIGDLQNRVESNPDDLTLILQLGERLAVRGEYEAATRQLNRIITEDADNERGLRVQAHHTLGKYMYLRGARDYDAARSQFAFIIEEYPDTPQARDARYQTLVTSIRSGDHSLAEFQFTELLGHEPEIGVINSLCWLSYRERYQMERAIGLATETLASHPTDHSLWDTLAELHFASGDREAALLAIGQAIGLDPEENYYQRQQARFSGE